MTAAEFLFLAALIVLAPKLKRGQAMGVCAIFTIASLVAFAVELFRGY